VLLYQVKKVDIMWYF